MLRWIAALAIALFTVGAQAAAYSYTGGNFYAPITNETTCASPQSCGQLTTSLRVTGTFTTATPLAANLSNANILANVTSYSFSNGATTIALDPASRISSFRVTTNAAGAITGTDIWLQRWTYSSVGSPAAGPHAEGDRVDLLAITGSAPDFAGINLWCSAANIGTSFDGTADTCLATGTDTASSLASATAGTWAVVPDIGITNANIAEGNSGTTALVFNVTLSAAPATPVSVNWSTADGTATAGTDYVAGTGTLSWAAGDPLTKTITVQVNGDTTVEPDETLSVTLSAATGGTIAGPGSATGTILNDDVAVPPPVASATAVPTLSEWGLMLLTMICAMVGAGQLQRQRRS